MQESYDRNRVLNVFDAGSCVGVIIPKELRQNGVQMIPAIVIRRLQKGNDYVYQLGVKGALLDRWYVSADLVPLSLPAFRETLGIPNTLHVFDVIDGIDWWGYDERKQSHATVELSAAYTTYVQHYVSHGEIQDTSSTVKDVNTYAVISANADVITLRRSVQRRVDVINIDDDLSVANDLIALQLTSTKRKTRATTKPNKPSKRRRRKNVSDNVCCVCEEILSGDNWHSCHTCKRAMHGKIICSSGSDIIIDKDDDSVMYCSVECSEK
jgi:hypothetical protein